MVSERLMKEKINRLAKGIIDSETPKAELIPPSFEESVSFSGSGRRELSLRSVNGLGIKGLCYSDNPRVRIENAVFLGNKNRIAFRVDPSFLKAGTVIYGRLCLITNAGEFSVPYRFTAEGVTVYDRQPEEEEAFVLDAREGRPQEAVREETAVSAFKQFILEHLPEDPELFTELTSLLIREQQTDGFAFRVYEEAVRRDVRLTRLYEYYIYAVPEDFSGRIPKEILLYFAYDSSLDPYRKSVIYKNLLEHPDTDPELFRRYEPEMRDYALRSVLKGRIDGCLAVIYEHMIYPDMIDAHIADILPALLKTSLIQCPDSRMRKVAVRYPELTGEELYPLEDGKAYVPLYFPEAEILFLDSYGRYYRGVEFRQTAVMHKPELLRRCFELKPDHPMIRLSAVRGILRKGVETQQEKDVLLDAVNTLPLRPEFVEQVVSALVSFGGSMDFLKGFDVDRLPGAEKKKIFSCLVETGELELAYAMVKRYGLLIAEEESLCRLCVSMIGSGTAPVQEGEDLRFFVSACRRLYDEDVREKSLLSYLCSFYEGATEDMYGILRAAEAAGADTGTIAERILIAKLFAGGRKHLDEAFAAARQKDVGETVMRAYFSVRCHDYFVEEAELPESFFDLLYGFLLADQKPEKLPSLYLLAWTRHFAEAYASMGRSGGEQEPEAEACRLCERLLSVLLSDGLVFGYMKRLAKHVAVPGEIMEKNYIEYHGSRSRKPRLFMKIEPEDRAFHEEEMRRVYQGIYLKEVQLFTDDELHYRIYEDGSEKPVQEGVLNGRKTSAADPGSRYGLLDQMTAELLSGDEAKLRESMTAYVLREEMNLALFGIRE